MLTIRSVQCSSDFLSNKQLVSEYPSCKGYSGNRLSGRFSSCTPRFNNTNETVGIRSRSFSEPRLESKPREVQFGGTEISGVFGYNLGHRTEQKDLTLQEDSTNSRELTPVGEQRYLELGVGKILDRQARFCVSGYPYGSPLYEKASTGKQMVARDPTEKEISVSQGGSSRLSMVVTEPFHSRKDFHPRADNVFVNRRIGHGLGLSNERDADVGDVDTDSESLAHQQEGIVHRAYSREEIEEIIGGKIPDDTVRQQNCCGLLEKSRGDEIKGSFGTNERDTFHNTRVSDIHISLLPSRILQHNGRLPVKGSDSSRLAYKSGGDIDDFFQMGNPGNRFVCDEPIESSSRICNDRCERHASSVHKRVQQTLGVQARLDIPTTSSNSQSSAKFEQIPRNFHSNSPTLGEGILEGRPQTQSSRSSNNSKEFVPRSYRSFDRSSSAQIRGPSFGSLEGTGWTPLMSGLSPDDVALLQGAWRDSTLRTYHSAWKQWRSWCERSGVRSNGPSASDICAYLSFLFRVKKLALSTILVHKSVVITLSSPEGAERLSGHPLIKTMLKAIGLKTSACLTPKSTIWNILDLVNWLKSHPPDQNSFFQVSRHTAILLLLASGRRIHDLTLISLDKDHCQLSNSTITFWPMFGSKTDRTKYRQSGWELRSSGDELLDLVKWVNLLIKVSEQRRRAKKNLFPLFITTRGAVRAATRTIIAGWLKEPFKDLRIEMGPGSIRSAVASFDFQNNVSIDSILEKGNWRGSNNFFKHYCKNVERPSEFKRLNLRSSFSSV